MKTKIANTFIIFLSIICILMLAFLAYHNFFSPLTVKKSKHLRKKIVAEVPQASPVVTLQTRSVFPGMKDSSSDGTGYLIDRSGLVLTESRLTAHTDNIIVTAAPGHFYNAGKIIDDPYHNIALFQIENPQIGLPEMPFSRPWILNKKEMNNYASSYRKLFLAADPEVPADTKVLDHFGTMPAFQLENILARHLIPERMLSMNFGLVPGMTEDGRIIVVKVFRRSPAYRAGIRRGMMITAFQGWDPAHDLIGLSRRLVRLKKNEPVKIQLTGAGTISVQPIPFAQCPPSISLFWKLGIFAGNFDQGQAKKSGMPFESGVIVYGGSPQNNMFRRGDIIVKWNRKPVRDQEELKQKIQNAPIGSYAYAEVYSVVEKPDGARVLMMRIQPVKIR